MRLQNFAIGKLVSAVPAGCSSPVIWVVAFARTKLIVPNANPPGSVMCASTTPVLAAVGVRESRPESSAALPSSADDGSDVATRPEQPARRAGRGSRDAR